MDLLELARRGIGASTGYMGDDRGEWTDLLRRAREVSSHAVELSALSGAELPGLATFLAQHRRLPFDYVSVHAPAKGWTAGVEELARALRSAVPSYVSAIVVHPETLDQPHVFGILGDRLLLENMDARKHDARTVEEMLPYFEALPEAGFCLDVAHAYINDRSLMLAHRLLDAFGDRLREVHLSSILDDGTHVPLDTADIRLFWPVLERCRDVPWILEAPLPRT